MLFRWHSQHAHATYLTRWRTCSCISPALSVLSHGFFRACFGWLGLISLCLAARFNVGFYKELLGLPLTIEDLAAVDYQEYTSIRAVEKAGKELLENMCLVFGHGEEELCFGGMEIEVNCSNRSKFIEMKVW